MTACNCCLAGMFGCGMAGSFQQLLAWRWVTGLGSALQMSGSQLCLADISRADNRARCLGTNQACITVQLQTCIQNCDAPKCSTANTSYQRKGKTKSFGVILIRRQICRAAHANTSYISRWFWVILTHTNELHVVVSDHASL